MSVCLHTSNTITCKNYYGSYIVSMRSLALMAFLALQLSVFTCGFDIHVHAAGVDGVHIAEHINDDGPEHEEESHEHGCHVHASHAFSVNKAEHAGLSAAVYAAQRFRLAGIHMKNLSFLIEHPPKSRYS